MKRKACCYPFYVVVVVVEGVKTERYRVCDCVLDDMYAADTAEVWVEVEREV